MDSLTQAALGAALGEAMLGKKIGGKAALIGAAIGTIPDLDVLLNPFFSHILLEVMVSEKKIKDFECEDLQIAPERRVDLRI